jgi:PKD repeat protein
MNATSSVNRACPRQQLVRMAPRWVQVLVAALIGGSAALPLRAETQTFSLSAQWNLITFQVTPATPQPEALFGTLPGFQSAWTYQAESGLWLRYVKATGSSGQQTNDVIANQLLALPPIEPGRAYWVQMANAVTAWPVSGTVPQGTTFPALHLDSGWNLIGIPVGAVAVSNTEPVSLLAVLTAAGFDYDALLTWENQSFRKMFRPQGDAAELATNILAGLPPDPPFPSFDLQRDLGRGYWIHVLDPAVLRPRLVVTVRPDIDSEPSNNFPAKEDLNVSGRLAGEAPRSIANQDVIRFFPGEDVQTLGVANVGLTDGTGGGILIWEAVWVPRTDIDTDEPWIRLFASPEQREQRDQNGQLLASHTNLTGVTTLENDLIYLRLDRKNLGRGLHQGDLLLRTSVGDRTFCVIAEVPGLEGDFQGFAQITAVNGKRNPVPDIDLNISVYEDAKVTGLLRGLIDSSQALLWPTDVPLIGHRVSDVGNQFMLGGGFVLPPGDQNAEPFDRWAENDPTAGTDVDWLNDGRLEARNPFPFPIQRNVSLEGALVRANPTDGYILEGKYKELVYGMSRQPILLEGTFQLRRQAARPLSSRRSIQSDTGVEPVISRKSSVGMTISAGTTRESSLAVATEMELHGVQVDLIFAAIPQTSLLIQLRSPGPNPALLTLYDGRTTAGAVSPKVLEHIVFPLDRPTQGDLAQFVRSVVRSRTEGSQLWTLLIANTGSQSVTLGNWTLRLEGQPVTDVTGIVQDGANPLPGVVVSLNGLPFNLSSAPTDAQGRFVLSRVPLLPLNFSGSRPGYLPLDPEDPGLSGTFTRPFVAQSGLSFSALEATLIDRFNPLPGAPPAAARVAGFTAGTTNLPFQLQMRIESNGPPRIVAGPHWIAAGGTVDFIALNVVSGARWDLGDGQANTSTTFSHIYETPGLYRVRLFSPANSATPVDTIDIVVMAAPGRAPARPSALAGEPTGLPASTAAAAYVAYAFQPVFTAGGVLPAHKIGVDAITGADRYLSDVSPQRTFALGETNALGAAYVATLPLQQTYAASMDIDLAPRITPANSSRPFASDGLVPLPVPGADPSLNANNQGFRDEDFNYAHLPVLWQNTRAADGLLEYNQDAVNGLIIWGNTLISPSPNYSAQTYEARDGVDFTWAAEDAVFHPHKGTTPLTDMSPPQTVLHLRMSCSLGAPMLTANTPASSVKVAKLRRSDPDNPLDPPLLSPPSAIARNLQYQFIPGAGAASIPAP